VWIFNVQIQKVAEQNVWDIEEHGGGDEKTAIGLKLLGPDDDGGFELLLCILFDLALLIARTNKGKAVRHKMAPEEAHNAADKEVATHVPQDPDHSRAHALEDD
jgi:hypothetical protein